MTETFVRWDTTHKSVRGLLADAPVPRARAVAIQERMAAELERQALLWRTGGVLVADPPPMPEHPPVLGILKGGPLA